MLVVVALAYAVCFTHHDLVAPCLTLFSLDSSMFAGFIVAQTFKNLMSMFVMNYYHNIRHNS